MVIKIPKGITILQACEVAGVEIPRFCYHSRLSIARNCRTCLVEVEKSPKPVDSCTMPALPGEFNNHEAARLRDSLRLFKEEEPILRMRRLMNEAIADERFEDAARYRDELKDIAPHSLLKCSSDATTLVWDLVTGRFLQTRAFPLPITAIVVDPTEMKLFSGGIDC
ncbi:unnamed protein product [Camellia sinensis]